MSPNGEVSLPPPVLKRQRLRPTIRAGRRDTPADSLGPTTEVLVRRYVTELIGTFTLDFTTACPDDV